MKLIILASLTLPAFVALGVVAIPPIRAQAPSRPLEAESTAVVIPVKGMSCMACVTRTKQALRAVPGVTAVEVVLSPGSVTVKCDPAKVALEKLAGVINDLGYEAGTPAQKPAK